MGKVIGAIFGWLFAGPIGVLLGIFIGHQFDKGLSHSIHFNPVFSPYNGSSVQIQHIFFESTFQVMGHIAKADGRVSERELFLAREVMQRMGLSQEQSLRAMKLFNAGKDPDFELEGTLEQFIKACRQRAMLVQMFLEIQLQVALADGHMSPPAQSILRACCTKFGLPPGWIDNLAARVNAEERFYQQSHQQRHEFKPRAQDQLQEAYRVMGVSADVTAVQLKKAYRKLMSEHHPDKLAAKGLPPEMMKLATEKTQQIQHAYEVICKARGI